MRQKRKAWLWGSVARAGWRASAVALVTALSVLLWDAELRGDYGDNESVSQLPTSYIDGSGNRVVVYNNDYLDRVFGAEREKKKRAAEAEQNDPGPTTLGFAAQLPSTPQPPPALLARGESFTKNVRGNVSARTAAGLRFAEKARLQLAAGDAGRALGNFERALSLGVGPYVPYIYFYLGEVHSQLGDGVLARAFSAASQAWLEEDPTWVVQS